MDNPNQISELGSELSGNSDLKLTAVGALLNTDIEQARR
jgi:hypothetical protein